MPEFRRDDDGGLLVCTVKSDYRCVFQSSGHRTVVVDRKGAKRNNILINMRKRIRLHKPNSCPWLGKVIPRVDEVNGIHYSDEAPSFFLLQFNDSSRPRVLHQCDYAKRCKKDRNGYGYGREQFEFHRAIRLIVNRLPGRNFCIYFLGCCCGWYHRRDDASTPARGVVRNLARWVRCYFLVKGFSARQSGSVSVWQHTAN